MAVRFFALLAFVGLVGATKLEDQIKKLQQNVDHIVLFMQENRAFDHYYGTLAGVRGFNDRVSLPMNNGLPNSFYQSTSDGKYMLPFRVDVERTNAECMPAPQMDYKCDMQIINEGRFDRWNTARAPGNGASFFTRHDLPYYYALHDAFLIGDQYFQSTYTCTNPNRLHFFSGSNGLSVEAPVVLDNTEPHPGFNWRSMAETLEAANISWRVYQEMDNFDDNALEWFTVFQKARPGTPLYDKGMFRSADLVEEFEKDLASGSLPAVSWIVGPTDKSEHATNHPSAGEDLTARILKRLAAHPEVYKRTIFVLNYDEGGQFIDHHWAPNPPFVGGAAAGKSSVTTAGEINTDPKWVTQPSPIGLGFRVPLTIVSPWTRGHLVFSEVLDHTSTLKLVEARFNVSTSNISPWRRAVAGDMLNAFDFDHPDYSWPTLPDTSDYVRKADVECATLPPPVVPAVQSMPAQEPGTRTSRALPYELGATIVRTNQTTLTLSISNTGDAGAALSLFDELRLATVPPRQYTVTPTVTLSDTLDAIYTNASGPSADYALSLFGPNGFQRQFAARRGATTRTFADLVYRPQQNVVVIVLTSVGPGATCVITDNAYGSITPQTVAVPSGKQLNVSVPVGNSGNWYDLSVDIFGLTSEHPATNIVPDQYQRFMGRMETGVDGPSDPAMAAHAPIASTALRGLQGEKTTEHPLQHPVVDVNLRTLVRAEPRGRNVHKDARFLRHKHEL